MPSRSERSPIPTGGFTPSTIDAGDKNRRRAQGQINISQNQISDSLAWGISVVDGFRDLPLYLGDQFFDSDSNRDDATEEFTGEFFRSQPHTQFTTGDYVPHGGTGRLLPNVNEERIVPGLTISNNVISENWEGGLQLNGDPNGIVIRTYDLRLIDDIQDPFGPGDMDMSQFTIWDHTGNSQTFEFSSDNVAQLDHIPVRFDVDAMNDVAFFGSTWAPVAPATIPEYVAYEIEHAIRLSDLDVKVYRGEFDTLFVEGAVEIGHPDVRLPDVFKSAFSPPRSSLPLITAEKVQQGSVLYSRVVNNTIVGRGGSYNPQTLIDGGIGDIGIQIEDNSSPTLLNNIVANFSTGIFADESSTDENILTNTYIGSDFAVDQFALSVVELPQSVVNEDDFTPFGIQGLTFFADLTHTFQDFREDPTTFTAINPTVIGATLYQGNLNDTFRVGLGDFAEVLTNDDPLFVDRDNGNYFLAEGSKAIDSSVSVLPERSGLNSILGAVGLESSGIEAPSVDVFGILRVDDPRVEPPGGLGSNVFVDRGALERADFVGPSATITAPADNDGAGIDRDPALNSVFAGELSLSEFIVTLSDSGTAGFGSGIDDASVVFDAITLFRDDEEQVQGVDYTLSYNGTNDTIRFLPAAGLWPQGSVYEILLDNTVIGDLAGNPLQSNSVDGMTRFIVQTISGLDLGDAPQPYPSARGQNGASHVVGSLFLGLEVTADSDAEILTGDAADDGVTFNSLLLRGRSVDVSVNASQGGGGLECLG